MFLYRTGLLLIAAVIALLAAVMTTDIEDRIATALCPPPVPSPQVIGDGTCGFNADMQAIAILGAVFALGLILTGFGLLLRRRDTSRRRMFGPRG
ncbi:hypothetical protein [Novispirillum itersonii]|uniref:Uncharacterized protein n=1 Tax=Novispirillum itersonii TaxID=189 RepID=A0A7W9ZGG3_NOVIT|nr:hypothetical protein [Novispirillum itersonii]MBB6209604.1 hypothetical protein [Novispirillum itersonii]